MADRAEKPPFSPLVSRIKSIVISGFNTDVEFDGVVYHIQTEDKGVPARKIVTLVYDGGTILASKRVNYDEMPGGEFDETKLADILSRQHTLICAAVKAGRMGELKEMTAKASGNAPRSVVEHVATLTEPSNPATPVKRAEIPVSVNVLVPESAEAAFRRPKTEMAGKTSSPEGRSDPVYDGPLFEDVSIIEEEVILPAEAVAVVSELSGRERPANAKLGIDLLGDLKFKGGDRLTVNFMICRGSDRKVVPDAQVMIKVLGSTFRPVIFHARSDSNGLAKAHLQLPHFSAGRAALLIRAISDGEEIELRRIITPG